MKVSHIRVHFHITIPQGKRAETERAVSVIERGCPVAQTLKDCVTFEYETTILEE